MSVADIETRPVTVEEYHRLGALGVYDGRRVELIRGEVVEMAAMGTRHTVAVALTRLALDPAFGPGFHTRLQGPLQILDSEPEPDAAVVVGDIRDYAAAHPTTALLVVEVSDATLAFDLTVKAELYAEAGIAEYWVVDLTAGVVHVLHDPRPAAPGGHSYRAVRVLGPADTISPLAAPAAAVRVADLLP